MAKDDRRKPHTINLNALQWAIFLAEGGCSASVPFGFKPLEAEWKSGLAGFERVLTAFQAEISYEYKRWREAWRTGAWPREDVRQRDFIRWLARVGYNANPDEWGPWESNVRAFYFRLLRDQARFDRLAE
jgi:hypothetical protein